MTVPGDGASQGELFGRLERTGARIEREATIIEADALIDRCHQRRACPRCRAELGERCHNLVRSPSPTRRWAVTNPHTERWAQDVALR